MNPGPSAYWLILRLVALHTALFLLLARVIIACHRL